jgi:hypothetical protein
MFIWNRQVGISRSPIFLRLGSELYPLNRSVPAVLRSIIFDRRPSLCASVPYLAYAPIESLADPATWRFFAGRAHNGQPKRVSRPEWARGAAPEDPRPAAWWPPGEAEIFLPLLEDGRCIGEFSVT